jgi:methyl-accepting chemotaxis protein
VKGVASTTVARRLAAGFGLVLGLWTVVTVLAMFKVDAIDNALQTNAEEHALIQRYAINFRGSAHDRAIALRDVVLAPDAAGRRKEVEAIEALADFYAQSVVPLEKLVDAKGPQSELARLYADIRAMEAQALASTQRTVQQAQAGDTAAAAATLWGQAKPHYVQWLAAINRLIDLEEVRIQSQNHTAMRHAGSFLWMMLSALALALAVSAAMAWWVSRSITAQLGAEPQVLADVTQRIAGGDLTGMPAMAIARPGSVLASLAAMQQSLARVVGQVRQASDTIATSSISIATGNGSLLQRTSAQSDHLQETAGSMQQMSDSVNHNADSARQAAQLATSARTAAEEGSSVVGQVVATMDEISASSHRIAEIIGVIDGIAFQTNLLALNAAVEAARAGDQGRGFAVVASEVRGLAQRSADAARQVRSLIDTSVGKVSHGTQLAGAAGSRMTDIVAQVQRVAVLIGEISGATQAQTDDIDRVGQAVADLEQSTQQNTALVEETASATDGLQHQAADLRQLVSLFKLDRPGSEAQA